MSEAHGGSRSEYSDVSLNPKVRIALLKTMGSTAKIAGALWIFFVVLYYLVIPLTQDGAQLPELLNHAPMLSVYGLGIALLFWSGSKVSAASASARADLEARFIGYMELYEDIGLESLADKLEMDVVDIENLIAQMKASGVLKNIAVSKETSRILYGKKAKEYLEATPAPPTRLGQVKKVGEVKTGEGESAKPKSKPMPSSRPVEVEPPPDVNGPSPQEIDDKLYSYVLSHKGSFSYSQASRELDMSITDLKESMDRLKRNGRVISYRKAKATIS